MSFELIGSKWGPPNPGRPGGTVTWSADLSDDLDFDETEFDTADFTAALEDAFEAWEDVAAIDFRFISDFGAADITIDMGPLAGSVVGEATVTSVPTSGSLMRIIDVDILLDSLESWSPFGDGDTDFFAVAAHEIGHAIGLDHVSDSSELMNTVVRTDRLGDGDIEGAQYLYGTDPEDVVASAPGGSSSSSSGGGGDGGSGGGGGGILLLVGGLVALLAGLFGGGASAAVVVAAASKPEDDDPDAEGEDGEDLMAFLDAALGDGAGIARDVHQAEVPEEADEGILAIF